MRIRSAFEYYGNKITWKQLWEDVDVAARALKALGLNEGDRVPSFLVSTPASFYSASCSRKSRCSNYLS